MIANIYLKKMWIGSNLKGIREFEKLSTYNMFSFEDLPPINQELTNDFHWLKSAIKSTELRNQELIFLEDIRILDCIKGVDYSEDIKKIEEQLCEFGIELPKEISNFFCLPEVNCRIRSSTDNFYELGDFIEIISADQTYYMLHFYSDSQYCMLWYICFREDGSHFIVATHKLYGHKYSFNYNEEFKEDSHFIGYYCANSFKEFIYRYDIEQRIWFKINWYKDELNEDEQEYVNHYLKK
jgi:hypothetical protein